MKCADIEKHLAGLKANSRGHIRGKNRAIDKIHAQHLRDTAEKDKTIDASVDIFKWLLGYSDFPEHRPGEGAYFWRKQLRKKLEAAGFKMPLPEPAKDF